MPHIHYSKSDLARLMRWTIRLRQQGRLRSGLVMAVFIGVADALDKKYLHLWQVLEANRLDLCIFQNGEIPLDDPT